MTHFVCIHFVSLNSNNRVQFGWNPNNILLQNRQKPPKSLTSLTLKSRSRSTQRAKLKLSVEQLTDWNINSVLFGDEKLSIEQNNKIMQAVFLFIEDSVRFKPEPY